MGAAASTLLIFALGLLMGSPAFAQEGAPLVPMQQFEAESLSMQPVTDRSAKNYARCAGMYTYALDKDASNNFAAQADDALMARALSLGSSDEVESLRRIRQEEREHARSSDLQRQAIARKLYKMNEREQANMSDEQEEALMRPIFEYLVFAGGCYVLFQELREKGGKQ